MQIEPLGEDALLLRLGNVIDPATNRVVRTAFAGNVIPAALMDPVALKMLQAIPLPNLPGTVSEYPNWRRRLPVPADAFAALPAPPCWLSHGKDTANGCVMLTKAEATEPPRYCANSRPRIA